MTYPVETVSKLTLRRQGENRAMRVVFDFSAWKERYGDGGISLVNQRPGESNDDGSNARYSVGYGYSAFSSYSLNYAAQTATFTINSYLPMVFKTDDKYELVALLQA